MSSELPDRLLGISLDDPDGRDDREGDEPEERERFVLLEVGPYRLALDVDDVKTVADPPATTTRIPRSPEAITGVTDLRGEITAVVDPRVHFPADESAGGKLVVFERPGDRQPAAMDVDVVRGVESVPAAHVLGPEELEGPLEDVEFTAEDVNTRLLEHPLVEALVVTVRNPGGLDVDDVVPEVPDRPLEPENTGAGDASDPGTIDTDDLTEIDTDDLAEIDTDDLTEIDTDALTDADDPVMADTDDLATADDDPTGTDDLATADDDLATADIDDLVTEPGDAFGEEDDVGATVDVETAGLVDVERFLLAAGNDS